MKCVKFLEPHQAQFSVYKVVFSHNTQFWCIPPQPTLVTRVGNTGLAISMYKCQQARIFASSVCHICPIPSTATAVFLAYQVCSVSSSSSIPISSFSWLPEFMFSNINLIMLIHLNSFPVSYSPVSFPFLFFLFTVQFLNTGFCVQSVCSLISLYIESSASTSLLTHTCPQTVGSHV